MIDLSKATTLVTGANDMIGLHVLTTLKRLGGTTIGIGELHSDLGSLMYLENEIKNCRPDFIFHVPSERYGIAVHREQPGTVYYESTSIFSHLLEAARQSGVKKVVNVLSNCVYPENCPVPHKETNIWDGLPEQTLIPHGMGRRVSLIHGAAYRAQYGLPTISVVLASTYGPHDNFDEQRSQVMGSMIRRFIHATVKSEPKVVCWGSGSPTREFIHVHDAVHGILQAAIHYDSDEPLNIGSQNEVSIRELTDVIARATGYQGEVEWDVTKPEGRARVCLDCTRMRDLLPLWNLLSLEEGVTDTANWFRATSDELG